MLLLYAWMMQTNALIAYATSGSLITYGVLTKLKLPCYHVPYKYPYMSLFLSALYVSYNTKNKTNY